MWCFFIRAGSDLYRRGLPLSQLGHRHRHIALHCRAEPSLDRRGRPDPRLARVRRRRQSLPSGSGKTWQHFNVFTVCM